MNIASKSLLWLACCLAFLSVSNGRLNAQTCGDISSGTLSFESRSSDLSSATKESLGTLAKQMQSNTCRVVVGGHGGGTKYSDERSWLRVNAVIGYMVSQYGLSRDRFISNYSGDADKGQVVYRVAQSDEKGSSTEEEPYPGLLSK